MKMAIELPGMSLMREEERRWREERRRKGAHWSSVDGPFEYSVEY